MVLTRRAVLSLPLAALAVPAPGGRAWAGCAALDLARGVAFRRQDGSRGLARREGDGTVFIDYVTNRGAWIDRRRVRNGVFEVSRVVEESEEPMVGASAPDFAWSHGKALIEPAEGAAWKGTVREVISVTLSDEKATVRRQRNSWTASYLCSDLREVTLSGCAHRALTVEASFAGKAGKRSQRWVYFPDLGLGLETRRDGKANGLVALTQA
ncbi:MAG: hypothetical protein R3D63_02710 [Paracoccaceae bacterium]